MDVIPYIYIYSYRGSSCIACTCVSISGSLVWGQFRSKRVCHLVGIAWWCKDTVRHTSYRGVCFQRKRIMFGSIDSGIILDKFEPLKEGLRGVSLRKFQFDRYDRYERWLISIGFLATVG